MPTARPRRSRSTAAAAALLAAAALGAGCGDAASDARPDELLVFAAASLQDALEELAGPFAAADGGAELTFNFAGSNVLATQIAAAPVADIFVSADERWMDWLDERGLIEPGTRRAVLSNRLVVIGHPRSDLRLESADDLAGPAVRRLSLGDPDGVPAGRYARTWLERGASDGGDLWRRLEARVVPAVDVRAALALVEADPDTVGVVYASDARSSHRVRVLLEVPPGRGPEIRYSAAVVRGCPDPASARRFVAFLEGEAARRAFAAHGFSPLHG